MTSATMFTDVVVLWLLLSSCVLLLVRVMTSLPTIVNITVIWHVPLLRVPLLVHGFVTTLTIPPGRPPASLAVVLFRCAILVRIFRLVHGLAMTFATPPGRTPTSLVIFFLRFLNDAIWSPTLGAIVRVVADTPRA